MPVVANLRAAAETHDCVEGVAGAPRLARHRDCGLGQTVCTEPLLAGVRFTGECVAKVPIEKQSEA
jgi:hypothetical protein